LPFHVISTENENKGLGGSHSSDNKALAFAGIEYHMFLAKQDKERE
jgi:hypothetical protein